MPMAWPKKRGGPKAASFAGVPGGNLLHHLEHLAARFLHPDLADRDAGVQEHDVERLGEPFEEEQAVETLTQLYCGALGIARTPKVLG
mgnify:CR=1 FL=1